MDKTEGLKRCRTCGLDLPASSYYPTRRGGHCKSCVLKKNRAWSRANTAKITTQVREWRRRNPERAREYQRNWQRANKHAHRCSMVKHKYGLTRAEYERLTQESAGKCAICQRTSKLAIDHDHETGAVRGMLCVRCNHGLGNFRDAPELLIAAVSYLKRAMRLVG